MQYYYLKTPITLGSTIDINGVKVVATLKLIKNNPNLFVIGEEFFPEYIEYNIRAGNCSAHEYYKFADDNKNINKIFKVDSVFKDSCGKSYVCTLPNKVVLRENYCKPSTKEAFERQELLEEAKRRYPVGTKFKSAYTGIAFTVPKSPNFIWEDYGIILENCDRTPFVYLEKTNEWAEIINPIFRTEDGIDIYEGDEYWYVQAGEHPGNLYPWEARKNGNGILNLSNLTIKRFSTKEAAEEYVKKNKPVVKDLKYYEDLLIKDFTDFHDPSFEEIRKGFLWHVLKVKEPKLFYLKVLELVQKELDDGWKPNWKDDNEIKYRVAYDNCSNDYDYQPNHYLSNGSIYFKSSESVNKAIEIMGNKLDYIFK